MQYSDHFALYNKVLVNRSRLMNIKVFLSIEKRCVSVLQH
jgi:hypothetical protein